MTQPLTRPDLLAYSKLAVKGPNFWVCGQLELTQKCFQNCKHCDSKTDPAAKGELSLERFKNLCDYLELEDVEHLSLTGGDPQAWPYLDLALRWYQESGFNMKLQINTALDGSEDEDWLLWQQVFSDVRLSLDAVDPDLYQEMRGVPMPNLAWILDQLRHPRLATITTVTSLNIEHIPSILTWLADAQRHGIPIRKAIFLPAMGVDHKPEFWDRWNDIARHYSAAQKEGGFPVQTSFAESALKTRMFLETAEAGAVRCYAGKLAFHMKANGDVYPCCLAGGEAVKTDTRFRLGTWPQESLKVLYDKYQPQLYYADAQLPCRHICQWKQTNINVAAHMAEDYVLSIP